MSIQTPTLTLTGPAPYEPDAFDTLCDTAALVRQLGRENVSDITVAAGYVKITLARGVSTCRAADTLGLDGRRYCEWNDLDGEYRWYAIGDLPAGQIELDGDAIPQ
ncbi:hypothetical protein [Myceligenerans crystallogenes]|uniref:Uncharacterized protein n=1 Tax=Myceligenerans crystallogenes TaxID=316335 RepID=A0ABP4ZJV1_9MICO